MLPTHPATTSQLNIYSCLESLGRNTSSSSWLPSRQPSRTLSGQFTEISWAHQLRAATHPRALLGTIRHHLHQSTCASQWSTSTLTLSSLSSSALPAPNSITTQQQKNIITNTSSNISINGINRIMIFYDIDAHLYDPLGQQGWHCPITTLRNITLYWMSQLL